LINQVVPHIHPGRRPLQAHLSAWLLFVIFITYCGCASVPHTGRRQFNVVSDSQINALALKTFNEVVSKEPESRDQHLKEIVDRVADRVSKAAETLDKPGFDWKLKVIEKDLPNAFCLPGGKIVVYSGLVPYAKNEAGLAAVIAHEVAHAVARHGAERLSQQLALDTTLNVSGEILRKKDGTLDAKTRVLLGALGMGGTLGIILPYSRTHEFEADRIGQIYMARAGYDPTEGLRLWERMSKINKPPIPEWLSTHPTDEDRIRRLREMLPEAMRDYEKAPVKYGTGAML